MTFSTVRQIIFVIVEFYVSASDKQSNVYVVITITNGRGQIWKNVICYLHFNRYQILTQIYIRKYVFFNVFNGTSAWTKQ